MSLNFKRTSEEMIALETAHFRKIDMSYGIYVVNIGGYIGQAVRNEIEYAQKHNKEVVYHCPEIISDRITKLSYKKATKDDIEPIYELCKQLIDKYEQTDAIDYPKVLNWVRKKIESSVDEYTAVYADGAKAAYYHFCKNEKAQFEIDDLYVFMGNERAVSLYKRLGFEVIETIGDSRYIMRCKRGAQ